MKINYSDVLINVSLKKKPIDFSIKKLAINLMLKET